MNNKKFFASTYSMFALSLIIIISFTINDIPATKTKHPTITARNQKIKSLELDTCLDLHFDTHQELGGKLATWVPFSDLVAVDIAPGVISIPFYLSSESGSHAGQHSEIWDLEFFDDIPSIGQGFGNTINNEFGFGPGNWPNDTHPALVARSTKTTDDLPDGNSRSSYTSVTGSLGELTITRPVKYVRARLRADINWDSSPNSVYARTARICASSVPQEFCVNVNLGLNAFDGYGNAASGGLRYDIDPIKNSSYTNTAAINFPAGEIDIALLFAYDAGSNRNTQYQDSEIVVLEFLNSANTVVATSEPSSDLGDNTEYAEFEKPLGKVVVPEAVVGVRAHHLPNHTSNQNTDDGLNVPGATLCAGKQGPTPTGKEEIKPEIIVSLNNLPSQMYEMEYNTFDITVTNIGNIALENISISFPGYINSINQLAINESQTLRVNINTTFGQASPYNFTVKANGTAKIDLNTQAWASDVTTLTNDTALAENNVDASVNILRIKLPV